MERQDYYVCEESFEIDEYEDLDDEPIGVKIIKEASIWILNVPNKPLWAEIRLEHDSGQWLEISRDCFEKYFKRYW